MTAYYSHYPFTHSSYYYNLLLHPHLDSEMLLIKVTRISLLLTAMELLSLYLAVPLSHDTANYFSFLDFSEHTHRALSFSLSKSYFSVSLWVYFLYHFSVDDPQDTDLYLLFSYCSPSLVLYYNMSPW